MNKEKLREITKQTLDELHLCLNDNFDPQVPILNALTQACIMALDDTAKILDDQFLKALERIDHSASLVEDMTTIQAGTWMTARDLIKQKAKDIRGEK